MRKFKRVLTVWLAAVMVLACTDTAAARDNYWMDHDGFDGYDVPGGYDYSDTDNDYFYDDIDDDYDYDYDDIDDDYDYDDIDDDYDYDDTDDDDDIDDDIDDDDDYDYDYDDTDYDDDDYDYDDTDDDDDIDDDIDDDDIDDDDTDYDNSYSSKRPAKKNKILTVSSKNCKVKVQSSSVGNPTVFYYGTTKKNATVINIPEKVTVNKVTYRVVGIADSAFAGNKKIKKVVIGKKVTKVGKKAFLNCKNLNQITVRSSSVSLVGKDALKNSGKNLVIKVPKLKVVKYKKLFSGKGNSKVKVKAA